MNEAIFWDIMLNTKQGSKGDPDIQQDLISAKLKQHTPEQIIEFDNIFRALLNIAYDWKLWAAAYIINGGCSDDCFLDFRGWLIAQGEKVYLKAIRDPDTLVELDYLQADMDYEGYSYLAFTAYEHLTGDEMPLDPALVHPSEPHGEEWDEDDLETLLPRLSQKFAW